MISKKKTKTCKQLYKQKTTNIYDSPAAIVATLGYNGSGEANNEAMSEEDEVSKRNIETQTNSKNVGEHKYLVSAPTKKKQIYP